MSSKLIPYNATIVTRSSRYLDELIRLKCGPDLLAYNVFPNAKEVTESFAAFNAVRKHLRDMYDFNDEEVKVIVVGDGVTPRTGATFAFRTKWKVFSIDPQLRNIAPYRTIKRLICVDAKIEECSIDGDKVLMVLVHSHADADACLNSVGECGVLTVIDIPCCIDHEFSCSPPDIEYRDYGIWSEKNLVRIWKNVLEPF